MKVVLCVFTFNVPSFVSFHLPISGPSLDTANNSKYVLIAFSGNKCTPVKVLSNFTELLTVETTKSVAA